MKIYGTAKGGALSKKDFGVAFSSGGGGTQITMLNEDDNITGNEGIGQLKIGYKFLTGHTLIDTTIESVFLKLKSSGSQSSGTLAVYAGQDTGDAGNNTLIGTVAASTISTSEYEFYEFTGTSYELQVNDIIWITNNALLDSKWALRYYANAAGGYSPEPPNDFWGGGGDLPNGNTEGTVDAGATVTAYRNSTASTAGIPPGLDGSTTGHPIVIKITYTE